MKYRLKFVKDDVIIEEGQVPPPAQAVAVSAAVTWQQLPTRLLAALSHWSGTTVGASLKRATVTERPLMRPFHLAGGVVDWKCEEIKIKQIRHKINTCREEHKKKHPDSSVNFAEFSKKCSERWKTMSAKEKSKFEDMAKSDKARYDREMKNYVPPKGDKKGKKKDPNAPKRPPSAFFLFCSEHRPKIKSEHPGLSIGDTAKKLGEMWSEQSAKDKQPYEQKAAKLKEKYEKDIAAYRAKGKSEAGKKGPGRPTGSKKKNEPEDEEEEEEEEDEDEEEEDEDEE
ncbi:TPA: high-mobility group box 2-like [Bos taurus]|nr:TPA: high-mobility group box 2-like [Bos taurus]